MSRFASRLWELVGRNQDPFQIQIQCPWWCQHLQLWTQVHSEIVVNICTALQCFTSWLFLHAFCASWSFFSLSDLLTGLRWTVLSFIMLLECTGSCWLDSSLSSGKSFTWGITTLSCPLLQHQRTPFLWVESVVMSYQGQSRQVNCH